MYTISKGPPIASDILEGHLPVGKRCQGLDVCRGYMDPKYKGLDYTEYRRLEPSQGSEEVARYFSVFCLNS